MYQDSQYLPAPQGVYGGQGGQQVVGPVPGQYADQGEAGDGVKHARKRKKKKGQGRPGES